MARWTVRQLRAEDDAVVTKWLKRLCLGAAILVGLSIAYVAVQDAGSIRVGYAQSPQPQHERIRRSLEQWRGFEMAAAELDSALLLPQNLDVWFADCGQSNAFYLPAARQVVVCYELVNDLIQGFAPYLRSDSALEAAVWHTTFFVFYHEIGHALIHMLDLPTTGREEDAVDQLATLVLLNGGDVGREAALHGASWFWLNSRGRGRRAPAWDAHALDEQRYYNIICWVYGSNPAAHRALLESGWGLPRDRAERCPAEFARMAKAWASVLEEHTY
ncbi:MAG TPA: DUF4344 domain-containing metallopeptidase [Gemmatimonadales bacterium]|nr:DUF4344 domain-containing metallopeptidase [Gemmatimonadales bacterium]